MTSSPVAALILQGQSAFNSLTAFNREFAAALRQLGIEPVLIDLMRPDRSNPVINQALADYGPARIVAAFSFCGVGSDAGDDEPDGNVWQRLRIPFVSWMLDHPSRFLHRHQHPAPAIMRIYPNMDFFSFQRDYVRAPYRTAYARLGTFNHGKEPQQRLPKPGQTPLILFPKSGGDPAGLEQKWRMLPSVMQRILRDAVDHYWQATPRSGNVAGSVLAAADQAGVELRNDRPLFSFFITEADDYIRYRKSDLLFRELMSLPVQIYGQGFAHIDAAGARAKIMPPIDHAALSDLYHEALAVVTINPNIDDDGHDRVYSAFGCGALPVSDINPWWRKECAPLLPYSYDFRDKPVTAAIERVTGDPMAAATVAWQFGQRMRTERPFQKAVVEVVELALMHRFFTFNFKTPQEDQVRSGA